MTKGSLRKFILVYGYKGLAVHNGSKNRKWGDFISTLEME